MKHGTGTASRGTCRRWLTAVVLASIILAGCGGDESTGPANGSWQTLPAMLITKNPVVTISDTIPCEPYAGETFALEYRIRIPDSVQDAFGRIDDIILHHDYIEDDTCAVAVIWLSPVGRSEWLYVGPVSDRDECHHCGWPLSGLRLGIDDLLGEDGSSARIAAGNCARMLVQLVRYRDDYRPISLGREHYCDPRAVAVVDGNIWVSARYRNDNPVSWEWTDSVLVFNAMGDRVTVPLPGVSPIDAMTQYQNNLWLLTEPERTIVATDSLGMMVGSFLIERGTTGEEWTVQIAGSTLFGADDRLWVLEWRAALPEWTATLLGIDPAASLTAGRAVIDAEFRLPAGLRRPVAVVWDDPYYYVHDYSPDDDSFDIAKVDRHGRLRDRCTPTVTTSGVMTTDTKAMWLTHTIQLETLRPTVLLSRFDIP